MKNHSCEEALDCLYSIYKISELVHVSDRFISYSIYLALTKNFHRQHYYASREATHRARSEENFFFHHSERSVWLESESNRVRVFVSEKTKKSSWKQNQEVEWRTEYFSWCYEERYIIVYIMSLSQIMICACRYHRVTALLSIARRVCEIWLNMISNFITFA